MTQRDKLKFEEQLSRLISPYVDCYTKSVSIRCDDLTSGHITMHPDFLNHLPEDVKFAVEVLVKEANV